MVYSMGMTKTHRIQRIHTSFGTRCLVYRGTERISERFHGTIEDAQEWADYLNAARKG